MSNKELPDWPDVSPAGLRKMAEIAAPNNGVVFRAAADEIERLSARAEPSTPPAGPLSSRLRPNVECAPWVIAEVVKLEQAAQPEPAAQDSARLDWLESIGTASLQRMRRWNPNAPKYWDVEYGPDETCATGATLRDAIDAARAATKPQGGA